MLRAIPLALALFLSTNLAPAQESTANPSTPQIARGISQPGGRISGQIILSDTRKPGRGVRVNIARDPTPGQHDGFDTYAMTDIDGRYQFDHLKPGDYYIRIHTNGYLYLHPSDSAKPSNPPVPPNYSSIASIKITLHSNEAATFDVTLQRSASLSGHVFYDDGSPAMGAAIRVEQIDPGPFYKPEPGEPSYMPILRIGDRGIADEHGYFRITTLGPGTYRVAASPPLQTFEYGLDSYLTGEKEGTSQQPIAPTIFSGDTIHRAQAKTYKLQPGDEISDIRINISLASFYKILGKVEADDGRIPNEGIVTLIDNGDKDIRFRTTLLEDGSFAFAAVPSGTYKIALSRSLIAKPDTSASDYKDSDRSVETNAFSAVDSTIIVKDSDILDLHFEVHEVPMPPKPPDDEP